MSTLRANSIVNAVGDNTAQINGMTPTAQSLQGFRNRIINGDMRIDQRNAGASVTVNSAAGIYTLDRWVGRTPNSAGVFTVQQSTTAPTGFRNSLLCTVTTAATPSGTDNYFLQQRIEGFNVADLMLGTATAQTFTVSFWVRSSVTGTFGASVGNNVDQSYPFSFTISAANTFEQKTVTIPGSTSGTWSTTTGVGLLLHVSLGAGSSNLGTANTWGNYPYAPTGSTNLISTNGATFYITGVQLEAGSVATPFERRDYGRELQMCQRYYEASTSINTSLFWCGNTTSGIIYYFPVKYAVTKRANPTTTISNISNSGFPNTITVGEESTVGFRAEATSNSTGSGNYFRANWASSAEL